LAYFIKSQQACQYQQDVNILQPGIVGAAFIHDDFFRKPVSVDCLLKKAVAAASIRHEVATVRLGFLAAKAREDK